MKNLLFLSVFFILFSACKKEIICGDYNVNVDNECVTAHEYFTGTYTQNSPPETTTIEAWNQADKLIFNRSNDCTGQYATIIKDSPETFYFQPQTYVANGWNYELLSGSGSYNGTVLNYTMEIRYNNQTVNYTFTGTK